MSTGTYDGALMRNNTSFPSKLTVKLQTLYEKYTEAKHAPANSSGWANILKYYQYMVRTVISDPEYGIGVDHNARGVLVYHTMGMGKTRLSVAVVMALWDERQPVVMLARSLRKNFLKTVDQVIDLTNEGATREKILGLKAAAAKRFSFVSMDAYNSANQMAMAGTSKKARRGELINETRGLDNKLLIVDEAHNFFRAIINSSSESSNARRMYDMIMGALNLRILFLTGTPATKDPFEIVPCFNMLTGREILPTSYEMFYQMYVDKTNHTVKNRGKLSNRIMGLVSHVTHTRPTAPPSGVDNVQAQSKPRDLHWFPEGKPTIVERVEMGQEQYRIYSLARDRELVEGKTGEAGGNVSTAISAPALALPGSEKKAMSSYNVRSRMASIFVPPHEWRGKAINDMPDNAFNTETGPKLAIIADRVDKCPGPALVYSQFINTSGLRPLGRFLENLGYKLYQPVIESVDGKISQTTPADSIIDTKPTLRQISIVDFPYASKFIESVDVSFKKLQAIAAEPPKWDNSSAALAFVSRTRLEASLVDSVVDHFAEKIRVTCARRGEVSPSAMWDTIRTKSSGNFPDSAAMRSKLVYSQVRGCEIFNCALATYLFTRYGAKNVLDCSAGWGSKLIAAHAAGVKSYRGWNRTANLQNVYLSIGTSIGEMVNVDWEISGVSITSDSAGVNFAPDGDMLAKFDTAFLATHYDEDDEWVIPAAQRASAGLSVGGTFIACVSYDLFETIHGVMLDSGNYEFLGAVGFQTTSDGHPPNVKSDSFVWRKMPDGGRTTAANKRTVALADAKKYVSWEAESATLARTLVKAAIENAPPKVVREAPKIIERWLLSNANNTKFDDDRPWAVFRGATGDSSLVAKLEEEFIAVGAKPGMGATITELVNGTISNDPPTWRDVDIVVYDDGVSVTGDRGSIRSKIYPEQCRELKRRAARRGFEPDMVSCKLAAAALRYESTLSGGQQLGLPRSHYAKLYGLGVRNEGFASPFNSRFVALGAGDAGFCSAFPDTDAAFGSIGPFQSADMAGSQTSWSLNPPYIETLIGVTNDRATVALDSAASNSSRDPLLIFVLVPVWDDSKHIRALVKNKYTVAVEHLKAKSYKLEEPNGRKFVAPFDVYYIAMRSIKPNNTELSKIVSTLKSVANVSGEKRGGGSGHYAIISGDVPSKEQGAIITAFNSPANAHGEIIKAILVSKTGAEGLDLKCVRETHQIEPYWDRARDDQGKARAIRMGSHDSLPVEEREVQPYLYIAEENQKMWDQTPEESREAKTIDNIFFERAASKFKVIREFRNLLSEVCFECEIFNYGSCRTCVPTDEPLYHDDPTLDIELQDPCEAASTSDVSVLSVVIGDTTYHYSVDPTSPFGYTFYTFDAGLNGHVAIDPADPVIRKLLKVI